MVEGPRARTLGDEETAEWTVVAGSAVGEKGMLVE